VTTQLPKDRAPSIRDVARLAGVSYQTVSRVLNNHPSIRETTRARVTQVMEELQYRPNRAARMLVTRHSRTIGVLSPNDTLARAIITSVKAAGKPIPVVAGQDSEAESVKSIMAGEQYSTINKDTRLLVNQAIAMVKDLQAGKKAPANDIKSYNNGVKVVPAFLLPPVIVTKANAAKAYANDPVLSLLTK